MNGGSAVFTELVEQMQVAFPEIDNEVCMALRNNSEYAAMLQEKEQLEKDYPAITSLLEGGGAISLTAAEHDAFNRYNDLTFDMENMERMQLYFCGHADNFSFQKMVGMK